LSTTISGNLGELIRTGPDRIAALDWALGKAARVVSVRRFMSHHPTSENGARLITFEGRVGQAYSEETFRYFLRIEQKRLERSRSPFLLLLVSAKTEGRAEEPFSAAVSSRLFSALDITVRDTDFTGWYRQGFVAGAVLTQLDATGTDIHRLIVERVRRAIAADLPPAVCERLDVRIVEAAPVEQS
jgi:hypothetical protein